MSNRRKRLFVSSILIIAIMLVSAYTVLAGSDFYESTYNNSHYICRSYCYDSYGKSKIEYADSSKLLSAALTIKISYGGQIFYDYDTGTGYGSVYSRMDVSGATVLSATHKYKISGTQVYSTTTSS